MKSLFIQFQNNVIISIFGKLTLMTGFVVQVHMLWDIQLNLILMQIVICMYV